MKDNSILHSGNATESVNVTTFSILVAISVAHLLNDAVQSVIPAVYPILKSEFSLTFSQIGIITLIFQMTSSILQPLVGRYADRRPQPYALTIGMMISLTGLVMLSHSNSFHAIIGAVAIIGMGSAVFHPEAVRVAQLAAGHRKGLAQSIFHVGGNWGAAIGPLLAAIIVLPHGMGAVLWFAFALVMGALVVSWIGRWYSGMLARRDARCPGVVSKPSPLPAGKVRLAMIVLVVLTFSKQFYLASMTSYFTFFLMDKFALSIRDSQLCLFAFLASSAVGIIVGGIVGDRIGRKKVIWGSILGAAPFALMLPYSPLWLTIVLSILIGLIISSAFASILVFATELKPNDVGAVGGLFYGLAFGMGGIGAAFFGWLAELTSIEFVFQVSTLLPLLGIVAAFLPDLQPRRS